MGDIRICGLCAEWSDRQCNLREQQKSFHSIACTDRYIENPVAIQAAKKRREELDCNVLEVKTEITPQVKQLILDTFDQSNSVNKAAKEANVPWDVAKKIITATGRRVRPAIGGHTTPKANLEQPSAAVTPEPEVAIVPEATDEPVPPPVSTPSAPTLPDSVYDTTFEYLRRQTLVAELLLKESLKAIRLLAVMQDEYTDPIQCKPLFTALMDTYQFRCEQIKAGEVA